MKTLINRLEKFGNFRGSAARCAERLRLSVARYSNRCGCAARVSRSLAGFYNVAGESETHRTSGGAAAKNSRVSTNRLINQRVAKLIFAALVFAPTLALHAQQQPQPQTPANAPLTMSFTAQFVKSSTNQTVETLTANDFRLFEDDAEQQIVSIEKETKPLSIVVIATQNLLCDVPEQYELDETAHPKRFRRWALETLLALNKSLKQGLTAEDEVAFFLADKNQPQMLRFNEPLSNLAQAAQQSSEIIGDNARDEWDNFIFRGESRTYFLPAIEKAVDYALAHKRQNSRPIILFVGEGETIGGDRSKPRSVIDRQIYGNEFLTFWFAPGERVFKANADNKLLRFAVASLNPFEDALWSRFPFELLRLTGGESRGCRPFDYPKPQRNTITLEQSVADTLDRLRTRFRISYNSTNTTRDNNLRRIRLELKDKRLNKGKDRIELRYQRAVVAPSK